MVHYDLIVIGGGMAGLSLLAGLKPAIQNGLTVALIDPAGQPSETAIESPSFDDRATALSAQTLKTFHEIGLEEIGARTTAITQIEVSDQGHAGYHRLDAKTQGYEQYGAVIANKTLGQLLWRTCKNLPIDWQFNCAVESIRPIQEGQSVGLSTGLAITASLVILCDGGRSNLHSQLGLNMVERPFQAHARVATVATTRPHQGKAFERFTPDGPIALLPFGDYSTLVWTIPDAKRAVYPTTSVDSLSWLNAHFGQRLGQITDISQWFEYPLIERQINQLAGHGFLMLGNAAATLHPVAGQGFNLALRGITRTAHCINRRFKDRRSTPSFSELNQLSDEILKDQQQTALFSQGLIRLFESKTVAVQLARGIGLNSLDRHPMFSENFALKAMGLLENTPPLPSNTALTL